MAMRPDQVEQFHRDGFVIVEDVFTPADLQPAMDGIADIVDHFAELLYDAGKIPSKHADKDFHTRLAAIERDYPESSVLVHHFGVLPPELAELWSCDALIDMVAQLIGPDIGGHPIWNIRSKTPQTERMTVPWHQDTAYLLPGAEASVQPAAWIPFEDIGAEIGAIQVVRGGHTGRIGEHYIENRTGNPHSWYLFIPADDLTQEDIVTCEMRFGSVLFLHNMTPHRSLENLSDRVRWSVDLRWQNPALPTGQEGAGELIVMRKADDPEFRPDWAAWTARAREERRAYGLHGDSDALDFEKTYDGGWLRRWERPIPDGARIG